MRLELQNMFIDQMGKLDGLMIMVDELRFHITILWAFIPIVIALLSGAGIVLLKYYTQKNHNTYVETKLEPKIKNFEENTINSIEKFKDEIINRTIMEINTKLRRIIFEPTLIGGWRGYHDVKVNVVIGQSGLLSINGVINGGLKDSTIMVLPDGYRPDGDLIFTHFMDNRFGQLTVRKNGEVLYSGETTEKISLNNIVFYVKE